MENSNIQTMPQTNQIEDSKPNVPKVKIPITGHIGCSMNGGHHKTIHWQYVMAGQHIKKGVLNLNIQMLTPKTPAYQTLRAQAMLVFVPHERVWTKYLEYIGQRGGTSTEKIAEKPNFKGKVFPYIRNETGEKTIAITQTTAWRDHWISAYIPRIGYQKIYEGPTPIGEEQRLMAPYDALPARAHIAIFNDVLRNREYEPALNEYKEMDIVTDAEWASYMPGYNAEANNTLDVQFGRARRNTSYYTDYRTELQGLDLAAPDSGTDGDRALLDWAQWESKIDLARENAQNAQAREIDILAKIRGSKRLSEGRVQVLAKKTFNINYSSITQTSYNTNEQIEEKFQVMGVQGAYSYTNISLPIGEDIMFLSDGTLHLILTVTADTVFETGLYRRAMTIKAIDEYRPELEDDKLDVIYKCEFSTQWTIGPGLPGVANYESIVGFKRRFNEYAKGNNVIQGDMTTDPLYETIWIDEFIMPQQPIELETNHTYQFFEADAEVAYLYTGGGSYTMALKKIWLDYTDLQINDNQAYLNAAMYQWDEVGQSIWLTGQNQIFMVGTFTIDTTLPISSKIINNYSEWGEH